MSTKNNQRGYIAHVARENRSDIIVTITYDLDVAGRFVGYNFYKIITALDASELSIPYGRQATFQEELRVLDKAYFAEEARGSIEDRIMVKLLEAYQAGERITIEPIR